MIGSVKPEICTKMLKRLSEKLGAKLPAATLHDDAFSEIFKLEASPVEGQSLLQKDKKRRKGKAKKNTKTEKPKDVGHFFKL